MGVMMNSDELHEVPGGHDWSYWRPAMQEILDWHAARFEYDAR